MFRGLNFLYLFSLLFAFGCGDKTSSLRIIGEDLFKSQPSVVLNKNFKYLKLQVNSNPFSFLALGYSDYDTNGDLTTVWYSNDNHVLRIKFDRLHSISAVSKSWYGMNHFTMPNDNFSINSSYKRVRFANNIVAPEIIENVFVSEGNNVPNNFKKFCNNEDSVLYVSEVSVDQHGNKLKAFYGFTKNTKNKQIKCVFQELDKKNIIKWIYI